MKSETEARKPSPEEVDKAIAEVALRELAKMPVGSTVMISECVGFQKMSFWWNVRVWGFWSATRTAWKMWRRKR